jgi:tetratricopeptide (TPR) repeat protein
MIDGDRGAARYAAFLSYSHKDAAAARWLHRKLETYRIPRRLVGSEGERGPVPARLTPIFRDREELPAAGDLSERVRAALAASENLIILCSPNSAASPWVAKEIATFRELHPGKPVFAAIVEGEPDQCFPVELGEGAAEPLAADLRPDRDGRRLGFLKLVAGLTGLGLDALVQRDAQRRLRRVTAVTAAALAAMLVMAVMTAIALTSRAEAQRQRVEAEGMVEFMLTDLRKELKGVGSLKVLTAANQRALDYYQRQDLSGLTGESLERRARILHAMGEDDIARNRLDRALARFEEAAETTARLLAEEPNDPDRIFNHAQSEFWIGHVAFNRDDNRAAQRAFERYRLLAQKLIALDPNDVRGLAELAYAEGSLCAVGLEQRTDINATIAKCKSSLAKMEQVTKGSAEPQMISAVANRYAWLADAYRAGGADARAWPLRRKQEDMLGKLVRDDPASFEFREAWLTNQFSMAELEEARGDLDAARRRLRRALAMVNEMTRKDITNANWASRKRRILSDLERLGSRSAATDRDSKE